MSSESLALLRARGDVLPKVTDFIYAVGTIKNKGSCFLISRIGGLRAVVITTSFVFSSPLEAEGLEATFMAQTVLGSTMKGSAKPVSVPLRPEKLFFSSSQPVEDADGKVTSVSKNHLGYTIVACDVVGLTGGNISKINPIPLPLVVSTLPPVEVGDSHLIVTHLNAEARKYYMVSVREAHPHHCVYAPVDPTAFVATGGPVFSENGALVGIQHMTSASNICVYVGDIVRHLFYSQMLGTLLIPIKDDDQTQLTPSDFIAGDESYDAVAAQRKKEVDKAIRDYSHVEVWKEWHNPKDYRSLVLMLHSFSYNSIILRQLLHEITTHEQKDHLHRFAGLGGVPALLSALDAHPFSETVVLMGLVVLSRIALFADNRDAICKHDGVAVVLALLKEFSGSDSAQQWGCYCLLNLMAPDATFCEDARRSFVEEDGIEVAMKALTRFPDSRYVQRWGCMLLAHVVRDSKALFDRLLEERAHCHAADMLPRHVGDAFVVEGIAYFMMNFTEHESFSSTASFFTGAKSLPQLAHALRQHKATSTPLVLEYCACTVRNMLRWCEDGITDAIEVDMEEALNTAALEHLNESSLLRAVAEGIELLGVDVNEKYSHLQMKPVIVV